MTERSFVPSRDLTFENVPSDNKRLNCLLRDHDTTGICLVLHGVEHCDSAGLALLIEAKRLCQQRQKTLRIEGMPKAIRALAEFCGVEAMLISELVT